MLMQFIKEMGLSKDVYRNCRRVDDNRHSVAARFGRGSVLIRCSIRPLVC
jgi:hypothetical protein